MQVLDGEFPINFDVKKSTINKVQIKITGSNSENKTNVNTFDNVKMNNKDDFQKFFKEIDSKIIEKIEVEDYIGKGSESVVYRGYDKQAKSKLTLKMILKKNKSFKNLNEIINSMKLKNKNIILYYGHIINAKFDIIMMEYAKFGNLIHFTKNILKTNYLSESLLCYFTYQILNGLKYCHTCKLVHLDIKPQNIVVDDSLNAKLIDFSISLSYAKVKLEEIKLPLMGTNFYIAPEIIKGKSIKIKDLQKIDLYGLGVTLHFLFFGAFPFGLKYEDSKKYDIINEKITNNSPIDKDFTAIKYSNSFKDFLEKLLEKDINKRININEALDHPWVKGAEILFDEKQKINNINNFLINLESDNFASFNEYIQIKNK